MAKTRVKIKKDGISTFIATLLLMVLAVSAGVVIYAYTIGYLGGFGGPQTMGAISLDTHNFADGTHLQVYVRNIGKTTFELQSVYIDGVSFTTFTPLIIDENEVSSTTITYATGFGTITHVVKLVGVDNTQISFNAKSTHGSTSSAYTLTLTVNPTAGGTVTADIPPPYHLNDVVVLTESPNTGYTFSGWSGDGTGTGTTRTVTITGNMAVTASYTQDVYTLTVTVNPTAGGTVTPDIPPPYHLNDVVVLTESPNTGYTFSGWSGDGTGTGTTRTVTMDGNKAVTATFTVSTQTLTLRPNGVGSTTSLSRITGSQNYYCVDDTGSGDGDSTYVYKTGQGDTGRDTYATENTGASGTISSLTIYIRSRQYSGSGTARTVIRTYSTYYLGNSESLTSSYAVDSTVYNTNPNTGSAWTWTEINALEIGVELYESGSGNEIRCTQVWVEVTYTP
jgi:uncharacterized repeat protein (TIGR02543 family)